MSGIDRGANLYFADMSGSGRKDMVQVLPTTDVAYTYYNECGNGGGSGGDDGPSE